MARVDSEVVEASEAALGVDEVFCDALDLVLNPGPVETMSEFEEYFRAADQLRAELDPIEFEELEGALDYWAHERELYQRFGWDAGQVLDWSLNNPVEHGALWSALWAVRTNTSVATRAHTECGLDDPRFLVECWNAGFESKPDVVENDLQATIDMRLADLPAGTTWIEQAAGGTNGIEVAFLGPDGSTLRVDHYTQPAGRLVSQNSMFCPADSGAPNA